MRNLLIRSSSRKHLSNIFLISILSLLLLAGCSDNSPPGPKVRGGIFIDSAVDGLEYETGSQQGVTNHNGTFKYVEGEEVIFKLGGIVIGKATGMDILTPIDLIEGAEDETDPIVTNICRFLQALDEDRNPENGIYISDAVRQEIQGASIDLTLPVSEFEICPTVSNLFNTLISLGLLIEDTNGSIMPTIQQARRHLRISMAEYGLVSAVTPKGVYMDPDGAVDDDLSDKIGLISNRTQLDSPNDAVDAIVIGNNDFGFKLYQELRQNENMFFSSYSISTSIAMIYVGTHDETASQIAEAAHFSIEQPQLHEAFNALDFLLNSPSDAMGENSAKFKSSSAAWAQSEYTVYIDFFNCLSANYGAQLTPIDFKNNNLQSRTVIEEWLMSQTENKLVTSSLSLSDRTRLAFFGTNTFEGRWATPFPTDQTQDGPFELVGGEIINVPMMHIIDTFNYAKGDIFEAIEFLFEDARFRVLLLIPESGRLWDFENLLEHKKITSIIESLYPVLLKVYLPKFAIELSEDLQSELENLGMQVIWDDSEANFTGINPIDSLYVKSIKHRAKIVVDETGLVAASTNMVALEGLQNIPDTYSGWGGVVLTTVSPGNHGFWRMESDNAPIPMPIAVSRPFIAAIYDRESEAVVYAGLVLDPRH